MSEPTVHPPAASPHETPFNVEAARTGSDMPTADFIARHPWLRRLLMLLLDAAVLFISLRLAYQIGFDFQPARFTYAYNQQFYYVVPVLIAVRLLLLSAFGLYRGFTRYTGLHELIKILVACTLGTIALTVFNHYTDHIFRLGGYPIHRSGDHILRVPRGIVIIDGLLSIFMISAIRIARRVLAEPLVVLSRTGRRVVIVGAGDEGEAVARELMKNQQGRYRPVAFVATDRYLVGRRIHGVPVAGTLEQLRDVARRSQAQLAVIALPRTTPRLLKELVEQCQAERLEIKIIPDLEQVMAGDVQISQLRAVEIEDLLGRPPVVVPTAEDRSCLRGKRVLVTGAGGSIGSEICRQALTHRPAGLVALGRGENSIYEMHQELAGMARELGIPFETRIGNIKDEALVGPLIDELRPQVILHAAAHKHVHFMEAQPAEAIKNNVLGTRLTAQAAMRAGVERFILISTDKAVRPTGVMGASKRVAEMVVSSLNGIGPTRFIAVRFGNVLGSRGSVIPLFRRQIAAGGPVTITHPEVTRYFMTIPEAVNLVLAAGTLGRGGEVFLLDMGQPVKIVDLARQLITLSGLEPGRDIQIEFTGLRPGEKLFEELLTGDQTSQPTEHEKIFHSVQPVLHWEVLQPKVAELEALAARADHEGIRRMLKDLIPDYRSVGLESGT